jgi:hypothetical protein
MTGSLSISAEQLRTIAFEVERVNRECDPKAWAEVRPGGDGPPLRIVCGTVVTVTLHPSLQHGHTRKRVMLHRAFRDSHSFGLLRDGTIVPTADCA